MLRLRPGEPGHRDRAVEHGSPLVELHVVLGEVGRLDAVAEADRARVGRAVADERLEQGRLARAVRADERDVLPALDHERAALEQLLAACREAEPVDLDHDPAGAGRLQELEAERAPSLGEVLELARRLLALLLEARRSA